MTGNFTQSIIIEKELHFERGWSFHRKIEHCTVIMGYDHEQNSSVPTRFLPLTVSVNVRGKFGQIRVRGDLLELEATCQSCNLLVLEMGFSSVRDEFVQHL